MKHAPVHLPKSVLSERARGRLPASDFVFSAERRYPINDLYHGRLALIYVMSPSNAADRDTVVKAVLTRYPELRSFWESRFSAKQRATSSRVQRGKVVRPSRPARTATVPARRRERSLSTNPSEEDMPIYVVNPLAYDQSDVVMVGKPRHRLIKSRTSGKPGRRSERLTLPSSETHALNPKTGAAFCGAGEGHCVVVTPDGKRTRTRTGTAAKGMIHKADKNLVTCYRCIKILQMNFKDWKSFPLGLAGPPERRAFTERNLKPGKEGKREKHLMIRGGEQGRWISGFSGMTADNKNYRIYRQRTAETGGSMYRGTEDIKDFEKYVGWRGKPTQTIGEKRTAILAGRRAAEEAARTAEAARRAAGITAAREELLRAETMSEDYYERMAEVTREAERSAEMARRGRMGAAVAAERRAARVAADAERGAAAARRMMGPPEAYVGNPRRGGKSTRSQKAGLAKGQNLMQQAAAAYRAGKYDSMQEALRGVARGGRRKNPTLLEESMVSNPRRRKFEEEDGSVFLLARSSAHFSDRAHERLKRYHVAAMVESRKNVRPLQNALKAYGHWVIEGNEAVSRYSMSLSEAENLAKSVAAGLGLSLHEVGGKITRFQTSEKPGRAKPYPAEEYMDNPRMRRNSLSEDGMVVSNPRRKGSKSKSAKSAQGNAARAMSLFRSGEADSLSEAWAMVKRGA